MFQIMVVYGNQAESARPLGETGSNLNMWLTEHKWTAIKMINNYIAEHHLQLNKPQNGLGLCLKCIT